MEEMKEFFSGVFATDAWPARWNCGYWSDFHGWLYILSDTMIWTSYFLIPLIIINYFTRKKEKIQFRKIYLLFASFILLCGATHLMDVMMFWVPMYRLNALLRLATGIVSLLTVYYLVKMLPDLFAKRTNVELENEILLREEYEQKLAASNEGLRTFSAIASHDLQEPLRKIRLYTGMLLSKVNSTGEEEKKLMAKVEQSASRMQSLIDDLLLLSTLNSEIPLSPVSLEKAVHTALNDLELKIKEKNASVTVGNLPEIIGNEGHLTQLFYNLVLNSIKFNERAPVIEIAASSTATHTVVTVRDNGIGISAAHHEKIFEALQRLHSKSAYEGTGLGLAIVKRIVAAHKGTITVFSNQHEGTTFSIQFPTIPAIA